MKEYKTADAYLEAIKEQKVRDPVITFQINNGFEPIGVLKNYLPSDRESLGYAAHLVWRNPYVDQDSIAIKGAIRPKDWVRVATVQFQQRAVSSFEEFISNIEYFVDVVSDYKSDFVVFPELFTLQLLALEKKRIGPIEAIETLTKWTEPFVEALSEMALSYNINIIGGSHPTMIADNEIRNIAYVFLRDGTVHTQEKSIQRQMKEIGGI